MVVLFGVGRGERTIGGISGGVFVERPQHILF